MTGIDVSLQPPQVVPCCVFGHEFPRWVGGWVGGGCLCFKSAPAMPYGRAGQERSTSSAHRRASTASPRRASTPCSPASHLAGASWAARRSPSTSSTWLSCRCVVCMLPPCLLLASGTHAWCRLLPPRYFVCSTVSLPPPDRMRGMLVLRAFLDSNSSVCYRVHGQLGLLIAAVAFPGFHAGQAPLHPRRHPALCGAQHGAVSAVAPAAAQHCRAPPLPGWLVWPPSRAQRVLTVGVEPAVRCLPDVVVEELSCLLSVGVAKLPCCA